MTSGACGRSNHTGRDKISKAILRCVEWSELGDGATSIGHDHQFTGLDAFDRAVNGYSTWQAGRVGHVTRGGIELCPSRLAHLANSDQPEREHGPGHPFEAGDVRTDDVVARCVVVVGDGEAGLVDARHDLGESLLGVLEAP